MNRFIAPAKSSFGAAFLPVSLPLTPRLVPLFSMKVNDINGGKADGFCCFSAILLQVCGKSLTFAQRIN